MNAGLLAQRLSRVARIRTSGRGFTMIEILLVVVILGVLAAVVVPLLGSLTQDVERGAFVADIRVFSDAAELYRNKTGMFLEDAGSGFLPAGFAAYIDADEWLNGTPVGGVWDSEFNSFGVTSALGVHFDGSDGVTRDDEYMLGVDLAFDDGDLVTGRFRKLAADRYYFIVRE